jgi:hypothetical protein
MESTLNLLMTGAIALGFAVAGLFFFRFWRETGDRLFLFFACSFLILTLNRVVQVLAMDREIRGEYFYWIRLLAFAIILAAILDKNRARPPEGSS